MIYNYLIVAARTLLRNKGYSIINIAGLAIGMACCILILLYIGYDLSFDEFHSKRDRIVRVIREDRDAGGARFSGGTSAALADELEQRFPQIEEAVRIWLRRDSAIKFERESFSVAYLLAEETFLDVFDFPLVKGHIETALKDPFSLLITEEMATRIYGDEDPVGKPLTVVHRHFAGDYTITGVLRDIPENSSIQFDLLSSTPPADRRYRYMWYIWRARNSWVPTQTFALLRQRDVDGSLGRSIQAFARAHWEEKQGIPRTYHLQPLDRLHLHSRADYGLSPQRFNYGDIDSIYVMATVAAFVLLIACINFMNLSTARSLTRAREVGLRKTVGAYRSQLVGQFVGEGIFVALIALLCALAIVQATLPDFGAFVYRDLTAGIDVRLGLAVAIGFAVLVGLIAGSYPAFYLSAFRPALVMRGAEGGSGHAGLLRRALVVGQFFISIVLLIGTFTISRQLSFVQERDLGFDRDEILVTRLFGLNRDLSPRYESVKEAFLRHPGVLKATASHWQLGWVTESLEQPRVEGFAEGEIKMHQLAIDEDYLDTYDIELVQGRNFDAGRPADVDEVVLLNEAAVRALGWKDPIGKPFAVPFQGPNGRIVGVVEDFNFQSLHKTVEPAFMFLWPYKWDYLSLKISKENPQETIDHIRETWATMMPDHDFNFWFLDDTLNNLYWREVRQGQVVGAFSTLAVLVACLGLVGLASYSVQRRTKEIGVRRVLGGSTGNVALILTGESTRLVLLANVIAWPVAYYAMSRWLESFAYRTDLGPMLFVASGVCESGGDAEGRIAEDRGRLTVDGGSSLPAANR